MAWCQQGALVSELYNVEVPTHVRNISLSFCHNLASKPVFLITPLMMPQVMRGFKVLGVRLTVTLEGKCDYLKFSDRSI